MTKIQFNNLYDCLYNKEYFNELRDKLINADVYDIIKFDHYVIVVVEGGELYKIYFELGQNEIRLITKATTIGAVVNAIEAFAGGVAFCKMYGDQIDG